MIRLIKSITVASLDGYHDGWLKLDIVPATASVEVTEAMEDSGMLATLKLSAILRAPEPSLRGRTIVRVEWCDGSEKEFGSEDLPVRWESSLSNSLEVSVEYSYPVY